jgi:hypothetical protein
MRPVSREEIVDYQTWEEQRPGERAQIMKLKDARRVHVGEALTFLFETRDTVRYQVQEMMRAEQIVREKDIVHEIETYNELLGGPGELGCTLLIELDDPAERDRRLHEWKDLPSHLYARVEGGERVRASFDPRQVGEERLSSVQYLKFPTGGRVPVAIGADHPALQVEAELSEAQKQALASDLAS